MFRCWARFHHIAAWSPQSGSLTPSSKRVVSAKGISGGCQTKSRDLSGRAGTQYPKFSESSGRPAASGTRNWHFSQCILRGQSRHAPGGHAPVRYAASRGSIDFNTDPSVNQTCAPCLRDRFEGHPQCVLNVNYPGGKNRQISLHRDQLPAISMSPASIRQYGW